jgi:hypothetical protein
MAEIYPFSNKILILLSEPPKVGDTHRWLAQVAAGLRDCVPQPEQCYVFLRECCDSCVKHRAIPDAEILAAVRFGYGLTPQPTTPRVSWPDRNDGFIRETLGLQNLRVLFDPSKDAGLTAQEALTGLFAPEELVCGAWVVERPIVTSAADWYKAGLAQFVCANPMRALQVYTDEGKRQRRCKANVLTRRWLVAEFDQPDLGRPEQAKLISALATLLPLKLVVDSGGKSLHAWFRCEGLSEQDAGRFFYTACALGADRTLWDASKFVRMPGGTRTKDNQRIKQKIIYWDAGAPRQNTKP